MKVVLTVPAFFPESFGGGESYVHRVASELLRRGHVATVVTTRRGGGAAALSYYKHGGVPVVGWFADPAALDQAEAYTGDGPVVRRALREILAELRPDVVHANGLKPAAVAACRELGLPIVVTAHHAGIGCPAGTLVRPSGEICALPMSPGACVPCASTLRRPGWKGGRLLGAMPRWLYDPIGRRLGRHGTLRYLERGLIQPWLVERSIEAKQTVLSRADVLVAPSAAMRELLLRNGCDARRVTVIPHGVEPLRRTPLAPMAGRPLRLGYVGRIDPLKGLRLLLDALGRLPPECDCELEVYGAARNPRDEAWLDEVRARYRGRARVRFHGRVEHDALQAAFGSFDVLVVPSLLPEAFGLVVLEAFSAGRPAIVTRAGALPELVRDGMDGAIVERYDAEAFAAVLRRLIESPVLVEAMAARTPEPLTVKQHVDRLMDAYTRASSLRTAGSGA